MTKVPYKLSTNLHGADLVEKVGVTIGAKKPTLGIYPGDNAPITAGGKSVTLSTAAAGKIGGPSKKLGLFVVLAAVATIPAIPATPSPATPGPIVAAGEYVPVDPKLCGIKDAAITTTFIGKILPAGRYVGVHFAGQIKVSLKPGEKIECISCTADAGGRSYCFDCTDNLGDFSFTHGELSNVSSAFIVGSNYFAQFNRCRGSDGDAFKASKNGKADSNDVADLGRGGEGVAHGDVMQIRGGSGNQLTRNYCDCQHDAESNSLFFVQLAGNHDNLCAGNFYSGGNVAVHVYDSAQPATNRVIANVFQEGTTKHLVLGCQSGTIKIGNHYTSGKLVA